MAIVCMVKTGNISSETRLNSSFPEHCTNHMDDQNSIENAEFDWDKSTQTKLLSSFFYGFICTQIIGGWLSDTYGGRRFFGVALIIAGIASLVTPVCARTSVNAVFVVRVILGLSSGLVLPSGNSIIGRWAPIMEKSKLTSFAYLGGFTVVWAIAWFLCIRDTPDINQWISKEELNYIKSSIQFDTSKRTAVVPWCQIAKNPPFLAILLARFCVNWVLYALVTSIPTFMKTVLTYDIQSNGAVSSLPFACQVLTGFLISQLVDYLRKKCVISTTFIRRLCSCLGFVGSGVFLIGTGFTSCEDREIAVVLLSLAFLFNGFHNAGCLVNNIDIGQKYAGTLLGLTNTLAIFPGMVAPIVTGILTPNDTAEEWRNMFYVCAGVCLLGTVVYGCFASGEVQEWAKDETEINFEKPENNEKIENTKF
ncbi:SLC17A5 [Mytilus coruscus]|uniref:SLC17A5 n=1 Tax=Mytilus coruscus TaxID=42192 RepID=A0A6J8DJ03_MYTCO|nr:SLC17A5 [Mytilus coruscus]